MIEVFDEKMLLVKINTYFLCLLTVSVRCITQNNLVGTNHYTIYQITAFTETERHILQLTQQILKYTSFLNGITNEAALPIYVAVNNCCLEIFTNRLSKHGIIFEKISDYQFEPSMIHEHEHSKTRVCSLNKIRTWVKSTSRKYSNMLTDSVYGYTFEHKELSVIKLSEGRNNPAVFIMGGEDGRDWLSPDIILQFMKNILEKSSGTLTKYYDFFFIPIANPDGYIFSKSKERFWAKNRKQFYSKKLCPGNTLALGVNIDRNWFDETQGFERSECSNYFPGERPLSEEETINLAYLLNKTASRTIAFFNLRPFDQLITLPYAQGGKLSINHDTLVEIFNFACEHLVQKFNTTYYLGSTSKFFYNFSGNSADWVKTHLNVPIVATIYLKSKQHIMADFEDIDTIYEQFETLIFDVLDLAKDLYGPLFNNQRRHSRNIATFYVMITMNCKNWVQDYWKYKKLRDHCLFSVGCPTH